MTIKYNADGTVDRNAMLTKMESVGGDGIVLRELCDALDAANRRNVPREVMIERIAQLTAYRACCGTPAPPDDRTLERWGNADTDEIGRRSGWGRRDDGYWTPWHMAEAALTTTQVTADYWNKEHTTARAENQALRQRVAELSETWTDEAGTCWTPPTAWAYAQLCRVEKEQRASAAYWQATAEHRGHYIPKMAAWRDVLTERGRQIGVEGWTTEHDDKHGGGELAEAASCYALHASGWLANDEDGSPTWWPWDESWWKPGDARRDLVKAGALILAEIERLDHAALETKP